MTSLSPHEVAVLGLIQKGYDTPEKIARYLNLDLDSCYELLDKLERDGYLESYVKGFIFKRRAYRLTMKGFEELCRARDKLSELASKVNDLLKVGDREKVREVVMPFIDWLPLLLILDLVDYMWFYSLLSLIGVRPWWFPVFVGSEEVPTEVATSDTSEERGEDVEEGSEVFEGEEEYDYGDYGGEDVSDVGDYF